MVYTKSYCARHVTKADSGFSLVELLMVVAIIAILAAILIPSVGMVRKNSQRIECASNMRQLAISLLLWTNENNTRLPGVTGTKWDEAALSGIAGFEPEDSYSPILCCPADTVERTGQNPDEKRSYSINPTLINLGGQYSNVTTWGANPPRPNAGISMNRLDKPSRTIMLLERHMPLNCYTSGAWLAAASIFPAHGDLMNVAFCDGHIEAVSTSIDVGTFRQKYLSRSPLY